MTGIGRPMAIILEACVGQSRETRLVMIHTGPGRAWPGLVEEGERDENPMAPDGTYAENYLKLITQVITNIINMNMIILDPNHKEMSRVVQHS